MPYIWFFQEVLSLAFWSFSTICLALVFYHLSFLVFSEIPGSVVCCPMLIWGNSVIVALNVAPNIAPGSLSSYISITLMLHLLQLSQFGNIEFFFFFFQPFFFLLFGFEVSIDIYWSSEDFFFSQQCPVYKWAHQSHSLFLLQYFWSLAFFGSFIEFSSLCLYYSQVPSGVFSGTNQFSDSAVLWHQLGVQQFNPILTSTPRVSIDSTGEELSFTSCKYQVSKEPTQLCNWAANVGILKTFSSSSIIL